MRWSSVNWDYHVWLWPQKGFIQIKREKSQHLHYAKPRLLSPLITYERHKIIRWFFYSLFWQIRSFKSNLSADFKKVQSKKEREESKSFLEREHAQWLHNGLRIKVLWLNQKSYRITWLHIANRAASNDYFVVLWKGRCCWKRPCMHRYNWFMDSSFLFAFDILFNSVNPNFPY